MSLTQSEIEQVKRTYSSGTLLQAICKAQLAKTDAEWEAKIKAERERIIKEIEKHEDWYSIKIDELQWQSLKEQIREGLKPKK